MGEARATRAADADDEVPPGAVNADFKTLQQMIAKSIQESETDAALIEKDKFTADDPELRRRVLEQRRKREEDAAMREREREVARQRRRREDLERKHQQEKELERQEEEEAREQKEKKNAEAQCRRELAAASRIQANVRGWRSRNGKLAMHPAAVAKLHTEPWLNSH